MLVKTTTITEVCFNRQEANEILRTEAEARISRKAQQAEVVFTVDHKHGGCGRGAGRYD